MGPDDVVQYGSDQGTLPPPNHYVQNTPRYWQDYAGDAWRQVLETVGAYPTEGRPTADQARLATGMFGSDGFNSSGLKMGLSGSALHMIAPQASFAKSLAVAGAPYAANAVDAVRHMATGESGTLNGISKLIASGVAAGGAGAFNRGASGQVGIGHQGNALMFPEPARSRIPMDSFRIINKQLPASMTGPLNRMTSHPPNQPWGKHP